MSLSCSPLSRFSHLKSEKGNLIGEKGGPIISSHIAKFIFNLGSLSSFL